MTDTMVMQIEHARRMERVSISALARESGIQRQRIAAILNWTPEDMENLRAAATRLGLLEVGDKQ